MKMKVYGVIEITEFLIVWLKMVNYCLKKIREANFKWKW